MAARLADFAPLRPAEQRLVDWIVAGNREACVLSDTLPPEDAPEGVRLRASFVRYLALGGCDACRPSEKGLRVQGAFIEGDGPEGAETRGLDLEGCRLPGDLELFACRFPDLVLMRGAEVRSVFLNGSALGGGLSSDRLEAKGGVFLRSVTATGAVRLLRAKLGGDLSVTGATFSAVGEGFAFGAEGLETKGNVFLRGVTATGAVRLRGARLNGGLDADRSIFTALGESDAFSADGLEANGNVFLRSVTSVGAVRLSGVKLGGMLDLDGATMTAEANGFAFLADGLEARRGVFMSALTATGAVRLLNAKLGGDLDANGATFTAVGEDFAIGADGLEAKGSVFLRGVTVTGTVRLLGAKIEGDLGCEGMRLANGEVGKAMDCDGMRVGGTFYLRKGASIEGALDLIGAEIGHMVDDLDCWPQRKGDLLLDRCRYGAFLGRSPVDAPSRIRWLSLQDEARWGVQFWPQPWEECARVLREMGHGTAARDILVEKERRQRAARRARVLRSSLNLGPLHAGFLWFWDSLAGITIGYGRVPFRAFGWLFGFVVVGTVIFGLAERQGALKPSRAEVLRAPEWVLCGMEAAATPSSQGLRVLGETQYACYLRQPQGRAYPGFQALVYSADALLPVIDFEMQANWQPDPEAGRTGALVRVYLWLHILCGWGLTLLAVAGFSGLVRTDNTT